MAEALQTSDEAELSLDAESAEVDGALLELEQALHRREALIVVTSHRGRQHSSLVRTALARFDEAYVVVLISPANAEPILALDRLLETAGHEIGDATGEEKQAALGGLIDRAGELGRPVIVVVDDADLATVAQLERLRTALNIDPGARRPVQLVLAGTQKLVRNLKSREARGLWTRVTAHVDIPEEETPTEPMEPTEARAVEKEASTHRWPLMTLVSAGVLVAALLIVASLARNFGSGPAPTGPVTAIEPARAAHMNARPKPPALAAPGVSADTSQAMPTSASERAGSQPSAPPDAQPPAANTQPSVSNARPSIPSAAPPAADSHAGTIRAQIAGAPAELSIQPGGLVVSAATAKASADQAAQPQSGPRVTQWMGVEQIHGSAGQHISPAVPPAAAPPSAASDAHPPAPAPQQAPAQTSAPASPAATPAPASATTPAPVSPADTAARASAAADQPAASPAPQGPQLKRGAQIVEVDEAKAAPGSPAAIARATVAADMAKATQATEGDAATDEEAAKKSEALSAPTAPKAAEQADGSKKPAAAAPANDADSPPPARTAAARAASGYEIQLGAFRTMANAAKVRDAVLADFPTTRIDEITVSGSPFYRVRVGPFPTAQETSRAEEQLRSRGFTPVRFNSSIKEG